MIFYKLYFKNNNINEIKEEKIKKFNYYTFVEESYAISTPRHRRGEFEFFVAINHDIDLREKSIQMLIKNIKKIDSGFDLLKWEEIPEIEFWTFAENWNYFFNDAPSLSYIKDMLDIPSKHRWEGKKDIILQSLTKKEVTNKLKSITFGYDFREEVNRIAIGGEFEKPLHYIFVSKNTRCFVDIQKVLLNALYDAGRIKRKKHTVIKVEEFNLYGAIETEAAIEYIYDSNKGGVVIFEKIYSKYLSDTRWKNLICEYMNRYQNEVTTVLCLNAIDDFAELIEKRLHCNYIEFRDEIRDRKTAEWYLKARCIEGRVSYSKELLKDWKEKTANELDDIFENYRATAFGDEFAKEHPEYEGVANLNRCLTATLENNVPKVDYYQELQSLIGLEEVKTLIDEVISYNKYRSNRALMGLENKANCRHMIFTGNPGTAKTTVARLIAEIFAERHITQRNKFVECGRSDLIAGYVGWTAINVKAKFREAKGGVLFIDEAYSLVDENQKSFGDEAISTIVQEMENNKDDTVVIFAGYRKEMNDFIETNPGLKSRIPFHINFPDYGVDDLIKMTKLHADKMGLNISECEDIIINILSNAIKEENFGNGRYVRNMLEKAQMRQAMRVAVISKPTYNDYVSLKPEDFDSVNYIEREPERRLGFIG